MPFPTPISLDPPVILGFQTGRGARNDNPRTGGDKKSRSVGQDLVVEL
jgi:hypothetical protein